MWKEKISNKRKFPVRENQPIALEPPLEKCRTKKIEKGGPQEWSVVLKFSKKYYVSGIQLVQKLNPNGHMPAAP